MRPLGHHKWIVASVAVVALTAACSSDRALGPRSSTMQPSALLSSTSGDTTVTVLSVDPSTKSTFSIGGIHKIVFPAGSVCDPAVSSYGPTEWDNACTPVAGTITITAKSWTDSLGHPRIDFSPALRFVPSQAVVLSMKDRGASLSAQAKIVWCADSARTCVDESIADPSLVTELDPITGTLTRRVKHFSAYNVTTGVSGTRAW